jgi:hypothetical protein
MTNPTCSILHTLGVGKFEHVAARSSIQKRLSSIQPSFSGDFHGLLRHLTLLVSRFSLLLLVFIIDLQRLKVSERAINHLVNRCRHFPMSFPTVDHSSLMANGRASFSIAYKVRYRSARSNAFRTQYDETNLKAVGRLVTRPCKV